MNKFQELQHVLFTARYYHKNRRQESQNKIFAGVHFGGRGGIRVTHRGYDDSRDRDGEW